jgi:hypothetical protein
MEPCALWLSNFLDVRVEVRVLEVDPPAARAILAAQSGGALAPKARVGCGADPCCTIDHKRKHPLHLHQSHFHFTYDFWTLQLSIVQCFHPASGWIGKTGWW